MTTQAGYTWRNSNSIVEHSATMKIILVPVAMYILSEDCSIFQRKNQGTTSTVPTWNTQNTKISHTSNWRLSIHCSYPVQMLNTTNIVKWTVRFNNKRRNNHLKKESKSMSFFKVLSIPFGCRRVLMLVHSIDSSKINCGNVWWIRMVIQQGVLLASKLWMDNTKLTIYSRWIHSVSQISRINWLWDLFSSVGDSSQ